jgi:hypothetical protein
VPVTGGPSRAGASSAPPDADSGSRAVYLLHWSAGVGPLYRGWLLHKNVLFQKKKIRVTSNLRYMHEVLNVDEIKN